MAPLVALGLSLLPSLARLLIGDRAGQVAATVGDAVREITGTDDPLAARQKIEGDAAAAHALRVRLAEIALEGERLRSEAAAARRRAEFDRLAARLSDVAGARGAMVALAGHGSTMAWGAPVVSVLVTAGFFLIVAALLLLDAPLDDSRAALVNITVGALGAAFTAVVNFWIGSSQGSREKDRAMREMVGGGLVAAAREPLGLFGRTRRAAPASRPPVAAPAAPGRFERCLRVVLAHEGGFVDDPADPGGATNLGITRATLAHWRGRPVTVEEVRALTEAEAGEIYRAEYWNRLRCDDLPAGVDLCVFDCGVNAGPGQAARQLQRAVGVREDGSIGPITVAAVRAVEPLACIDRLSNLREAHWRALPGFARFGRGWMNRLDAVRRAARGAVA